MSRPLTWIWLALMAATAISTWGVSAPGLPAAPALIATLLIAAFKARLVLLHFMDLGDAPWRWRGVFEAWILIVTAALLAIALQR